MARRDYPYLPLYVDKFLTDEKLLQCSASATGVYIRMMCLMHKSEKYGKILLRGKNKVSGDKVHNFATVLSKGMPFPFDTVLAAVNELIDEGVVYINGDELVQPRMVRDSDKSEKCSKAGQQSWNKRAAVVPEPTVRPVYQTPTRSNIKTDIPDTSVVSWRNIARYEYADMDDWIKENYTELEFNAFIAFNKWIDEECASVRERTAKQIEFKNFAKLFRKLGGNKSAADQLKDAMIRVAGGTITPDHDLYSRVQMYLKSPSGGR